MGRPHNRGCGAQARGSWPERGDCVLGVEHLVTVTKIKPLGFCGVEGAAAFFGAEATALLPAYAHAISVHCTRGLGVLWR